MTTHAVGGAGINPSHQGLSPLAAEREDMMTKIEHQLKIARLARTKSKLIKAGLEANDGSGDQDIEAMISEAFLTLQKDITV